MKPSKLKHSSPTGSTGGTSAQRNQGKIPKEGEGVAQPLSHLLPAAEWPRGQGRTELNLQDTQATSSAGMARTHLHPGGHRNVPSWQQLRTAGAWAAL